MKIFPLSEGSFTIDKTKQFVPFNKETDDLQKRPVGSLLVEIQPFLVITSKDIIVIDTGLGFTNADGTLQLHANILQQGISPNDVTKVLVSHLHKDHSGGIALTHANGTQQLSFEHATYYVGRAEFAEAQKKGSLSYEPEAYAILATAPNVVFLEEEGVIDGYIAYSTSGGHSVHHQVFTITDNGQTVFFGGDVAPQAQQLQNRFMAKYDYDGKKSMELRQLWKDQGTVGKWTFLFYHDIKNPVKSF